MGELDEQKLAEIKRRLASAHSRAIHHIHFFIIKMR